MNVKGLKEAITAAFSVGRTPHVIGAHGIGKSSVIRQWCVDNGYAMFDVRLGIMSDTGDFSGLGKFIDDPTGQKPSYVEYVKPKWFVDSTVGKSVIFLDEINRAHKDILQGVFQLVWDKELYGSKLGVDCHVIAASNPPGQDYMVTDFSDPAFQDRFVHIKFEPTSRDFFEYAEGRKFNHNVLDFLKNNQDRLLHQDTGYVLDFVKPSNRSWETFESLEVLRVNGKLSRDVCIEMMQGVVGTEATQMYLKHLEMEKPLPRPEEIINNYAAVRAQVQQIVQQERAEQIGIMTEDLVAFSTKATDTANADQTKNVLTYLSDLPNENFVSFLMSAAVSKFIMQTSIHTEPEVLARFGKLKSLKAEYKKKKEAAEKAKEEV